MCHNVIKSTSLDVVSYVKQKLTVWYSGFFIWLSILTLCPHENISLEKKIIEYNWESSFFCRWISISKTKLFQMKGGNKYIIDWKTIWHTLVLECCHYNVLGSMLRLISLRKQINRALNSFDWLLFTLKMNNKMTIICTLREELRIIMERVNPAGTMATYSDWW